MSKPHHAKQGSDRRARRRSRPGAEGERRHRPLPLTPEGVPAATPDMPATSPVVHVSEASRSKYPWLPARVISGSVWRGPGHLRVRVDESGDAAPWRCGPAATH